MESELLETDPFANINESLIEAEHQHHIPIQEYFSIIGQFLVFLAYLCAAAAYIFLSLIIIRYRKLRTRINIYILNIAVIGVVNHMVGALVYIVQLFDLYNLIFIVAVVQLQNTVQALHVVFSMLLASDWLISGCKPQWVVLYKDYYIQLFFTIYTAFLIEWIIAFAYAEMHHLIRLTIFNVVYAAGLIYMIVLNILKRSMNISSEAKKTSYALVVANIFVFALIPVFLYHVCTLLITDKQKLIILVFISVLPALVWLVHPIIVIVVLSSQNKYFEAAYKTFFKIYAPEDINLDESASENDKPHNSKKDNYTNSNEVIAIP